MILVWRPLIGISRRNCNPLNPQIVNHEVKKLRGLLDRHFIEERAIYIDLESSSFCFADRRYGLLNTPS